MMVLRNARHRALQDALPLFMVYCLFGVATANRIDTEAALVPAGSLGVRLRTWIADGVGIAFDSLGEAFFVLPVIVATSAILSDYRRRRKLKRKFGFSCSTPIRLRGTSCGNCVNKPERTGFMPVGGARVETDTSNAVGSPAIKATGKISASETQLKAQCDALVSIVSSGMTSQLPQLLDECVVIGSSGSTITCERFVTQCLLSALRASAAARCFSDALAAYDHVADRVDPCCSSIWSVLLYIAVEAGELDRCEFFFKHLYAQLPPSGNDFVNMVRFYSKLHDVVGLKRFLAKLTANRHMFDGFTRSRALAACALVDDNGVELAEALMTEGQCSEPMETISYNTLMKCYARAKQVARCFDIRADMEAKDCTPNEVTYGILLDACVVSQELDSARRVFEDLCNCGLRVNVVHCTAFIKCLVMAGRLEEAQGILREMLQSPTTRPDSITYATLVRAHTDRGQIEEALRLLEEMLQQRIEPEPFIFNGVLCTACAHASSSGEVARTFDKLTALGMLPTTATVSILLKAFERFAVWEIALATLEECPQRFGMEPETRLYVQLVQACVRGGTRDWALWTYEALIRAARRRKEPDDIGLTGRLARYCSTHGDPLASAGIQEVATRLGVIHAAHRDGGPAAWAAPRQRPPVHATQYAGPPWRKAPRRAMTGQRQHHMNQNPGFDCEQRGRHAI